MKYFSIDELTRSDTAKKKGIDNTPTREITENLETLINELLDPIRIVYGKPIYVNSGYRSPLLNHAVGGVSNSQHMRGEAVDLDTRMGIAENKKLFGLIKRRFKFDQLINESNYSWVHVSYRKPNRGQVLHL